MKHKAVFLDRDGTLITDKIYLNDPSQIEYMPHTFEALKLLRDLGFKLIVVTNQSGMPRGLVEIQNLDIIHNKMSEEYARHGIHIDKYYYAPFLTDSNHFSRKPNPGMLIYADHDFGIDFKKSWMIGDRTSDVEAGHRVGCQSILLPGNEIENQNNSESKPEYKATDLMDSALYIKKKSENLK